MKDIYLMNRETGEILPSEQAIKDFYRNHGILESWTDEWTETDMETNDDLAAPNFNLALTV